MKISLRQALVALLLAALAAWVVLVRFERAYRVEGENYPIFPRWTAPGPRLQLQQLRLPT
jgi:hypothetical protein